VNTSSVSLDKAPAQATLLYNEEHHIQDDAHVPEVIPSAYETPLDGHWPWASVDIPGSPHLAHLFEALKLHCAPDIEPLSLLNIMHALQSQTKEYEFISGSVLQNLTQPLKNARLTGPDSPQGYTQVIRHRQDVSASPYNELYPFSTSI